jgi:hypothetical protein
MLKDNQTFDKIQLTKSFMTYSYPDVQNEKEGGIALRSQMIESISKNIIGRDFSMFNIINQALYQALMGKHKVLLGEMPTILHRQIIASNLSLDDLKDIYKFVSDQLQKIDRPFSFREAAFNFLPHIFQAPKDLYMTAMLKESFQAATCIVGFVGRHHVLPIQKSWIPAPNGINMTQATRIAERRFEETDEDLIEKHALLDSLLEKRPWGQPYIQNPFPYLFEDVTKVSPAKLKQYIECFQFHYSKYEAFKDKVKIDFQIPSFKSRTAELIENPIYDETLQSAVSERNEAMKLLLTSSDSNARNIKLKAFGEKVQKKKLIP